MADEHQHEEQEVARVGESGHPGEPCTAAGSEPAPPTDEECSVLRHMLGIDKPEERHPAPYRDYYCADPSNPQLLIMEHKGLVERYSSRGGYAWYRCTGAGRAAAFRSHAAIRYAKSKRVYIRYLDIRDACPDLTFKDFLTQERFADARRKA